MKGDLRFEKDKKTGKYIIKDVSEYSKDDLISLYKTMKVTYDIKGEQKKSLYEQQKKVEEELSIISNRLNQIKKFMDSEGIKIPKEDKIKK